jgi:hypothetical protein
MSISVLEINVTETKSFHIESKEGVVLKNSNPPVDWNEKSVFTGFAQRYDERGLCQVVYLITPIKFQLKCISFFLQHPVFFCRSHRAGDNVLTVSREKSTNIIKFKSKKEGSG